jgi:malonate transporter and related proteins
MEKVDLMFANVFLLSAPLFVLVLVGYAVSRFTPWPRVASDAITRFVFAFALPASLFHMMIGFSGAPHADPRLLVAFFGGCLAVYIVGRVIARRVFALDAIAQSVFALGGVFSNNLLLGVPLAKIALGDAALPSVSLVLVFNSPILWTLITISVEWARRRALSWRTLLQTVASVTANPIVIGVLSGAAFSYLGVALPPPVDAALAFVAEAAAPLSLLALGAELAQFGVRLEWGQSLAICVIKLAVQPAAVFMLACALGLPLPETRVVAMLASLPVGANVYLMSCRFGTLNGAIASSLVLSTALSAVTTPLALVLTGRAPPP